MSNPFKCAYFDQIITAGNALGNLDEVILYASLRWQIKQKNNTLVKHGKRTIARHREQFKNYIGKGLHCADKAMKGLVNKGWLSVKTDMWKGVKSLFVSLADTELDVDIHTQKVCFLSEYTDSHKESIILAFIDYCRKERPSKESSGKVYGYCSRPYLAELLKCDAKTVDCYMLRLQDKGFIEPFYTRKLWGRLNYYVTINNDFYNIICNEWEAKEARRKEQLLTKKDETELSIRIGDDLEEINDNNTASPYPYSREIPQKAQRGAIILSRQEQRYLNAAFGRTIEALEDSPYRNSDNKNDLLAQVMYAITNPAFRKATQSFKHAVNRFMWLIRNHKWLMPYGFWKYDPYGQKEFKAILERENKEKHQKSQETPASLAATARTFTPLNPADFEEKKPVENKVEQPKNKGIPPPLSPEERQRQLEDIERRWSEWKYGVA